ncbi:hypothetical protein [uncultured Ramlibacter sp.]|uniref:hypothetical protein n=1 Tax=uncultured Ramlibacter sp. TaxID=260755 RepID=UPI00262D47BD|nr:hypothetical protein [uncultured Ramlibacter sp.]
MIVIKTEDGQRVMKDRSVALTPRQRSALILVDGKRTLQQLVADTAAAGCTREDLDKLFELGLIADGAPRAAATQAAVVAEAARQHSGRSPKERYAEAYPLATQITAALGLRGFRLNLAVEGAGNYEELLQVAPKILEAVGSEKYAPLKRALND